MWCEDCVEVSEDLWLHYVPPGRAVLLSVLTWSLYERIWAFKYWQRIAKLDRKQTWPFLQAVFLPLLLVRIVRDVKRRRALRPDVTDQNLSGLALAYFLLPLVGSSLPGALELTTACSAVFLYPILCQIGDLSPEGQRQQHTTWSATQIVGAGIGGLVWLLALWGYTLPDV